MKIHPNSVAILVVGAMIVAPVADARQNSRGLPGVQEEGNAGRAAGAATKVLLQEGTEVHLKLAQKLTSKTATVGEPVEFVLAEDLKVGEDVVARKGTRTLGVVTEGKKSEKQKNEAKQLSMGFDHMRVGDSIVKLRGQKSSVGKRDTGKMVTFTILFGLSGLAATSGKKFMIAEGTPATAYVDKDIELPVLPAGTP